MIQIILWSVTLFTTGTIWWAVSQPTWYSILIAVLMGLVVAVGVTIITNMHVA